MKQRWLLAGLMPALAVILLRPAPSQAQVEDWGAGWIHPAYTSYRAWFPPRRDYSDYYYYPAPAPYDYTTGQPSNGSWWYYTPATPPRAGVNSSKDARVHVAVPANAEVWFGGFKTSQTGTDRVYQSPPLDPGKAYRYEVRARWTAANGKVVDRNREVRVRAGQSARVDFNQ